MEVELSKLIPSTLREEFDEEKLKAMAETMKSGGILQPITVIPHGSKYQVLFGERRRRAAELAGLKEVPVNIRETMPSESEAIMLQLIENLQREDLTVMEKAKAYKRLMDMGLQGKDIAARIGASEKYVSEFVALLKLSEKVQGKVEEAKRGRTSTDFGKLGRFQARLIAAYTDDHQRQEQLADAVLKNKLKQTETRDLIAILTDQPNLPLKKALEIMKGEMVVKENPSKVWLMVDIPKRLMPRLNEIAKEKELDSPTAVILYILNQFLEKA